MSPKPTKPMQLKATRGEISAVPCPHCGKANDLRGFRDMGIDIAGAKMECDHCKRHSQIYGMGEKGAVVEVLRIALNSGKGNQTSGAINAVACPACNLPQDCSDLHQQGLLNKGNTITCDKCNAVSRVVMLAPVTILLLKPLT